MLGLLAQKFRGQTRVTSYRLANMTRREENVAASSFRAFSSFRSFIMVSVTMLFSVSYLVFRLDRASSAVYINTDGAIFREGYNAYIQQKTINETKQMCSQMTHLCWCYIYASHMACYGSL